MSAPLDGVARTALGAALMRAAEHRRPDRLFTDPYAEAFAPDEAPTPHPLRELMAFQMAVRTRFYDDHLLASCADGVRQVVLLAAGLDTRAHRLPWPPGVRLYEVDLPETLAFKDRVLDAVSAAPACERAACPADLRADWRTPLLAAGFAPDRRTAWLAEGLLIYLSPREAAALLTGVGALSAPGSTLALERGDGAAWLREKAAATPRLGAVGRLWKGGLGDDTTAWLARHGWTTREHALADLAAAYGRAAPEHVRSGFVTARWSGAGGRGTP
ncbi:SAM-dependent methyltransferase [Actinomadura kijaniata]|uniref:SAM-dependent methyltransferase n=1 Tax=Actinomadura kijaniata TaxID=46161 RepID=UPI003F1BF8AD